MAAKSGAGASVSSGAGFQARVGAYVLASSLCNADIELARGRRVQSVSFETTEAIDDLNLNLEQGGVVYIQAKAKIDYSLAAGGELRSVLEQFERQSRESRGPDQYVLVTSSRSSRKIIFEMRAALEAFRSGDEKRFRKDQPKALVDIIDDLLGTLSHLRTAAGLPQNREACAEVLRSSSVYILDVEAHDPIEQAIVLLLQSGRFAAPSALWGKMVADCVTHAKGRQTIQISDAAANYSRFVVDAGELQQGASDDLIKLEFGQLDVAVGREFVLGWLTVPASQQGGEDERRLVLMEFYRFDEECNERIRFENGKCILGNGLEVELIRRASTFVGMERMIEREPEIAEGQELTFIPFNGDEDLEVGLCAETHRAKVRQAALANPRPMNCVHCGRPVSSLTASMVEAGQAPDLTVGLSHQECLAPEDRVLGTIQSKFFEEHAELINFDPNAWFKAAHNGQRTFANVEHLRGEEAVLAWGGKRSSVEPGGYVVELLLQGGAREIATIRNGVHRFSKSEAEHFAERLNRQIADQGLRDPFCYTDENKAFGSKSFLVPRFGGKEKVIPVERARARPYDERFAARYTRPGSWYAPLLFLRSMEDGQPISILTSVALLTDPTKLANYISNWGEAGFKIPSYETVSLLTDAQFDDFMVELSERKVGVIVDPLLATGGSTKLVSGLRIRPIDELAEEQKWRR